MKGWDTRVILDETYAFRTPGGKQVTARDSLASHLLPEGYEAPYAIADRILAEHAHELAEKIRAWRGEGTRDIYTGTEIAADLIDPEVNQ